MDASETWPASLPQRPLVNGYSDGIGDGRVEYAPDTGPTLTRRRSTATPSPLTVAFEMTRDQVDALQVFVATNLLGGSLPFNFPAINEAGTYVVKFQKQGLPKWTALGGDYYNVTMSLWKMP